MITKKQPGLISYRSMQDVYEKHVKTDKYINSGKFSAVYIEVGDRGVMMSRKDMGHD